jgi:putative YphP/YqiW family bacilliredoxin
MQLMMYDERMVAPMRHELTRLGVQELRTAAEVDARLAQQRGTALVVVNSVCGCAARNARPALAEAFAHTVRPDQSYTVFAGQDADATRQARSYFTGYAPSSPQIAMFKDGKLVFMLERYQIEGRTSSAIAADLVGAFDQYCVSEAAPASR